MNEGFEIKVPITLKSGREGEKVGKQIGEKLAVQLKKTFAAVKIGGPGAAGPGNGAALLGVSKGLKGVAGKLGLVAAAIGVAVGVLAKASPYLKGILNMFGRAFMIFFRPFGDFLATLLRPLAIMLMKMAVAFLRWTRSPVGKATQKEISSEILQSGTLQLGTIPEMVLTFIKNIDFTKLKEFPRWLWDQMITIWIWTQDFGSWLWDKLTSIWVWTKDFGAWLWDQITSIFGGGKGGKGGKGLGAPVISGGGAGVQAGSIAQYLATGGPSGGPVPTGGIPLKGNKSVVLNSTFNISGGFSSEMDMDEIARRFGRTTEMELKQRGII